MTGSNIPPISTTPAKPAGPGGQVVQIVSLPDGLKETARAIRIEGEVVQQNKDGSIKVETPQGTIDISVKGRQPQEGAKIEIDIPAGSPPRQATIRPAPAQLQQPQPSPPPASSGGTTTPPAVTTPLPQTPPAQGQTPSPQQPLPNTSAPASPSPTPTTTSASQPAPDNLTAAKPPPPLQESYAPPITGKAATPTTPPPLMPDQFVKLVPVIENINAVQSPEKIIIAPQTEKAALQANMASQKTQSGLIQNLLQAVKSVLPTAPQTQTVQTAVIKPTINASLSLPVINGIPSLSQNAVVLNAVISAITSPSGQTLFATNNPVPVINLQNAAQTPVINAPVIDLTASKQPIIPIVMNAETGKTKNFIIQTPPGTLPVGTKITLTPLPPAVEISPQGTLTIAPSQASSITPLPTSQTAAIPPAWRAFIPLTQPLTLWPAMDEIFQTFYQATPQAAQILGRIIPSPANAANFGPAVMLFAAAIKSGDIQGWLGDKKLEMIQKLGKESLISRLSTETSSLIQDIDAPASDWKTYPIPLLWQNEISKIMLHVRQEADDQSQDQNETGTRFIMDLSLNRMGEVQLDGFVRGKRLDMIVRTELPISHSMQDAMKQAYAKALDGSDIYGEIGFQSDTKGWLHVTKRADAIGSA